MSISPHLLDIVLLVLLIAAALWDMSTRLIPNLLVGTGLVLAMACHFALSGVADWCSVSRAWLWAWLC